ncbi:MAG TPA: 2-hydroxyglutaryl-CoA dehydratase [Myxococcota bacterium]|jgi:predicted nucleotide-binding protein (sugar kinase/HSP70/actin superfamily)|nr:2-hydroxyglutaryl-CoA dehydratase [Myxococcota bacterium]
MTQTQTSTIDTTKLSGASDLDIQEELRRFEQEQRRALGLDEETEHWWDSNPSTFTASQRPHTTILVSGLTMAHDYFIEGALGGLGYKVKAMDCPDNEALRYGKEFGNRGQCNPTYFTVGNLVKYVTWLRDHEGIPTEDIIKNNLFLTAGACGPCRFGTYVTEYRKALRDAGFEGFRVILFQQKGGVGQAAEGAGLDMGVPFFRQMFKAVVAGDVLNVLGYRTRPYEVVPGATDKALDQSKKLIHDALLTQGSVLWACWQARRLLEAVEVDYTRAKPKVSIIGEFWAMTTEGDGNYKLQRFLESEGAEVDIQIITAWLLYSIWEARYDTRRRMDLKEDDTAHKGLDGKDPVKTLRLLHVADAAIRVIFHTFAQVMGLRDYHLPDMDEIAEVAHEHYHNELRGGEGHMEVGKHILSVLKKKCTMMLSVKPFGCMPSSGVSDGVQSIISEKYPQSIYCPIETNGDGAVNVYSRVQMFLFKARQRAQEELAAALKETGLTADEARVLARKRGYAKVSRYPVHFGAETAANLVRELKTGRADRLGARLRAAPAELATLGQRALEAARDGAFRWVPKAAG